MLYHRYSYTWSIQPWMTPIVFQLGTVDMLAHFVLLTLAMLGDGLEIWLRLSVLWLSVYGIAYACTVGLSCILSEDVLCTVISPKAVRTASLWEHSLSYGLRPQNIFSLLFQYSFIHPRRTFSLYRTKEAVLKCHFSSVQLTSVIDYLYYVVWREAPRKVPLFGDSTIIPNGRQVRLCACAIFLAWNEHCAPVCGNGMLLASWRDRTPWNLVQVCSECTPNPVVYDLERAREQTYYFLVPKCSICDATWMNMSWGFTN